MEEEKKIIVKLKKEPLKSEREEIKAKRKHKLLIFVLCIVLLITGIGVGYLTARRFNSIQYVSTSNNKFDEIKDYIENLWLYKNDYDNLDTTLEDKAFYGMTKFEEDPYTSYMSKEENISFMSGINMNYVGIGVQYYSYNDQAIITRVFKESPAENAGIKVGDIIKKVNSVSISGKSSDEIKEMVLGEEGSIVGITVERNGEEIDLMAIRGQVDSTIYVEADGDCVVLYLMSFGEDTANECIKYLDEYKDYNKLIIDLRDNSGGLQSSVEEVAGLFLGDNVVYMQQVYSDGRQTEAKTTSNAFYDNFENIAIITNANTASAAEVLAICMKEQHDNVTLVGETTFGKGVVQSRYTLYDGSTIKITTSEWLSPSGKTINGNGVSPDVEVLLPDLLYMVVPIFEDNTSYEIDSVSSYVKIAENALNYLGYYDGRTDGYFDREFQAALNNYKINNGLNADGYLNKEIYDLLLSEVSYVYSTDPVRDLQMVKAKEIVG